MSDDNSRRIPDEIFELLSRSPGLKGREIAAELELDKREVNSILFRNLRGRFRQDNEYRWWPIGSPSAVSESPAEEAIVVETDHELRGERPQSVTRLHSAPPSDNGASSSLRKLVSYYLEVLAQDDSTGVSCFASSRYDLTYCELPSLPFLESDGYNEPGRVETLRNAARIANTKRTDGVRYEPLIGYPVYAKKIRSRKSNWEGFVLQPIFLFDVADYRSDPIEVSDPHFPQINRAAIADLTGATDNAVMDEILSLAADLGLDNTNIVPDPDELLYRFHQVRAEWPWLEEFDPYSLKAEPSLEIVEQDGIYNRAIFLMGERSKYTKGLETELQHLRSVPAERLSGTALGYFLDPVGYMSSESISRDQQILEIVPLNTEQRASVISAFSAPLSVVTGPPGTGKSQVVTEIIVNAAWQGKSVLFSSRNNKAVDVVQERINALSHYPVLFRLGNKDLTVGLAEYLSSVLNGMVTENEKLEYESLHREYNAAMQKLEAIDQSRKKLLDLRNLVDRLEQEVEGYREDIPAPIFASFESFDFCSSETAIKELERLSNLVNRADSSLLEKCFWRWIGPSRMKRLSEALHDAAPLSVQLGLEAIRGSESGTLSTETEKLIEEFRNRICAGRKISEYLKALRRLSDTKSLENLARDESMIRTELLSTAAHMWDVWIKLMPTRLNRQARTILHEYITVLKMLGESKEVSSSIWSRYYDLSNRASSYLQCWAVTSLSANRRVPLEPGVFDLVVIDEASQCDIASALPLRYRAKTAVIIGDQKQLRHISGIASSLDQKLLERHDLLGRLNWSYSHNSLFDLASFCVDPSALVTLRDHHRSHADIIEFSNENFYDGLLRVATRYDRLIRPVSEKRSVRWIPCVGVTVRPDTGGAVNQTEARVVADEVVRILQNEHFEGSLGVVSPFRAQANRIRELVEERGIGTDLLIRSEFIADTAHGFQGDERDVIILSPALSRGTEDSAVRFVERNQNLFNVAVTRARSALIIVGDCDFAFKLPPASILHRFAEYVRRVETKTVTPETFIIPDSPEYPYVTRPETVSDWERLLYRALFAEGVRTIPQYQVDQYVLDLALIAGDRRLDIEVDGEQYHRAWNGDLLIRDRLRNQRMIELGWDVMRFWVYEIRDDLAGCIRRIQKWRSSLEPVSAPPSTVPDDCIMTNVK